MHINLKTNKLMSWSRDLYETCLSPCKQTPPCLCSWSNDWSNSALSDSQSVLVMSLAENSLPATQGRRGRLNAIGGTRDLSARAKNTAETLQTPTGT